MTDSSNNHAIKKIEASKIDYSEIDQNFINHGNTCSCCQNPHSNSNNDGLSSRNTHTKKELNYDKGTISNILPKTKTNKHNNSGVQLSNGRKSKPASNSDNTTRFSSSGQTDTKRRTNRKESTRRIKNDSLLGNNTNNCPDQFNRYLYRNHLRYLLRHETPVITKKKDGTTFKQDFHRIHFCGARHISKEGHSFLQVVKGEKGHNYVNNLMKCGSVWICPVCASKINRNRTELLAYSMNYHLNIMKSEAIFTTITIQHNKKESLKEVNANLEKCWKYIRSRRNYLDFIKKYEVDFVMNKEINYGLRNGWHPHKHIIFVLRSFDLKSLDQSEKDRILQEFQHIIDSNYKKWTEIRNEKVSAGAETKTFEYVENVSTKHKVVKKDMGLSEYFGEIYELVGTDNKKGRKDNFSYSDMLNKMFNLNEIDFTKQLNEYANTTLNWRSFQGLKNFVPDRYREKLISDKEILKDDKVDKVIGQLETWQLKEIQKKRLESEFYYMIQKYDVDVVVYTLLQDDSYIHEIEQLIKDKKYQQLSIINPKNSHDEFERLSIRFYCHESQRYPTGNRLINRYSKENNERYQGNLFRKACNEASIRKISRFILKEV